MDRKQEDQELIKINLSSNFNDDEIKETSNLVETKQQDSDDEENVLIRLLGCAGKCVIGSGFLFLFFFFIFVGCIPGVDYDPHTCAFTSHNTSLEYH